MEVRDGTMFVRPTDRKAGPHVLCEYKDGPRGGIAVDIEDAQIEKLAHKFEDKSQFNVVKDKYGWFSLAPEGKGDDTDAKVTIKDGGSSDE
jgi:hypothetical protein